jgi:hypothetical protein
MIVPSEALCPGEPWHAELADRVARATSADHLDSVTYSAIYRRLLR